MDNQDNNNISIKDLPIYHWHNKEEGKEEYARFVKQFKLSLKHLRYLLYPDGVLRRLGRHPGPAPALAAARRDWRDDMTRYEAKIAKVEEHFAAALSALESSFAFATSPRHIIDVATENPPAGIPIEQWSCLRATPLSRSAEFSRHPPSQVHSLDETRLGGAEAGVCFTYLFI